MSAADKTKLDGIAAGAEVNQTLGNYHDTALYTFDSSGNFTATGNVTGFSDIKLKKVLKLFLMLLIKSMRYVV